MKNKTAVIGISFGLALILIGAVLVYVRNRNTVSDSASYKSDFFAMDTACSLTLYGSSDLSAYRTLIERLDIELDCYNTSSDVYKFNLNGSAELSGNTRELFDKSKELFDGLNEFNEEAVDKLTDMINELSPVSDRVEALREYSSTYNTFSGTPDGVEDSVVFVFKN